MAIDWSVLWSYKSIQLVFKLLIWLFNMLKALFALMIFLFTQAGFAASCEKLFTPATFLSQLDESVQRAGLYSDGKRSEVCGLSCATYVNKIVNPGATNDILELGKILKHVRDQLEKERLVLDPLDGVPPYILAKAVKNYLGENGIKSEVQHYMVYSIYNDVSLSDITKNDFATPKESQRFVIMGVHGAPYGDPNILVQPSLAHAMLVTNIDVSKNLVTVIDPFKPNLPLHGGLESLDLYKHKTFRIEFDRPLLSEFKDYVFYVNDIIIIDIVK